MPENHLIISKKNRRLALVGAVLSLLILLSSIVLEKQSNLLARERSLLKQAEQDHLLVLEKEKTTQLARRLINELLGWTHTGKNQKERFNILSKIPNKVRFIEFCEERNLSFKAAASANQHSVLSLEGSTLVKVMDLHEKSTVPAWKDNLDCYFSTPVKETVIMPDPLEPEEGGPFSPVWTLQVDHEPQFLSEAR